MFLENVYVFFSIPFSYEVDTDEVVFWTPLEINYYDCVVSLPYSKALSDLLFWLWFEIVFQP